MSIGAKKFLILYRNLYQNIINMRKISFCSRLSVLSAQVAKKVVVASFLLGSLASAQTFPEDFEPIFIETDTVCRGASSVAHAAGFPINTYFKWYVESGSEWQNFSEGTDVEQVINVDFIGERKYKLVVDSVDEVLNYTILFSVVGLDCDNPNDSLSSSTDINSDNAADSIVNVYSVDGAIVKVNVKMSDALVNLKKGLYIIGNKKVYVTE